ncbi:MAG: ParB/RepB/Spo0J family partition protein [Candidatus Didemnitutus sp.]|nr:ParB/RepB/Spo0J family partition protein [Candidatus Didemnitutus sp.]
MTIASSPVLTIRVADITASPLNPRHTRSRAYAEEKLRELGESMLSAPGQLEAVLVRPRSAAPGKYELVNGERRWRAAKLGGMVEIAARVSPLTDGEALDIMLAVGSGANVEPLTALEQAEGYQRLMALRGYDVGKLAKHLGRSDMTVCRSLALLDLPPIGREALEAGTLSATTAWRIARIPGADMRERAAKEILNNDMHGGVMPERAAAEWIETTICRTLKGAVFSMRDATLLPSAGACETCRFRSGNNPEEYGDVRDKFKCMHPACFEQKVAAQRARVLAEEKNEGKQPLTPEENAETFKAGEHGLAFDAEFVAYTQPPTLDLLKKEITGPVPTWRALCGSRVQVYVGINQDGMAVDLVRLGEAFAAVSEPTIFNKDTVRRYGLAMESAIVTLAAKGRTASEIAAEKHLPVEHVRAVLARTRQHRSAPAVVRRAKAEDGAGEQYGTAMAAEPRLCDQLGASKLVFEADFNALMELVVNAHHDWKSAPEAWLIAAEAVLRRHDRIDDDEEESTTEG